MSSARIIFKNTSVLFIAQIITYIIGFFITMYTARYLGAEGFGIISLALSITGIFGFFSDLGLITLMIRDLSRDQALKNKYISNLSLMKLFLAFLMLGLMALTVNLFGYSTEIMYVIYLITFSAIISGFGGILNGVFQSFEKMEYISINSVLNSVLMLSGTIIGISYQLDILYFACIYVISNLLVLISSILLYVWKFSLPKLEIDLSFWKPTLQESWPFGVTGLFVNIYYWIDAVILSIMVGTIVVGWYNAAYRLIMVFSFIPIVLNMAIFPVMSKFYMHSEDSFRFIYERYFKYMTIIGIPLGIGTTLLADKIILLVYGSQYTPAIIALQILIWANVFIFMSGAFARVLEVSNRQLILTKITAICAVLNIILNLILIPKFSYIGASVVTVLTELVAMILGIRIITKIGYALSSRELKNLIKSIIASLIMGLFITLIRENNLFLIILLATGIYLVVLYIIRIFDDEDVKIIRMILKLNEN